MTYPDNGTAWTVPFEYWASLSNLKPKNAYSQDQHQGAYYKSRGADPYAPLDTQMRWFYKTYGGGSDNTVENIYGYFNSLSGSMDSSWLSEILNDALNDSSKYTGLSGGASEFIDYVLANQYSVWNVERTNWAVNPECSVLYGFSGAGGTQAGFTGSIDSSNPHSGDTSYLKTITVAGQTGNMMRIANPPSGAIVRWSFWVYSTVAGSLTLYAEGDRDGSYAGFGGGGTAAINANEWTKLSGAGTLPVGVLTNWRLGAYNLSVSPGDLIWFDEYTIEVNTPALGDFLTGSMGESELARYRWLGDPNQSVSVYETRQKTTGHQVFVQPDQPTITTPWLQVDTDYGNTLYISDGA